MSFGEDRSWMYNRTNENGDLYEYFMNGVQRFLDFAFSRTDLLADGKARCPCRRCCNTKYFEWDKIFVHLCKWGFVPQYHIWILHGETQNTTVPDYPNTGQSSRHNEANPMRDMVHDMFGGQFENENYNNLREEEPNREAQAFFELLKESQVQITYNSKISVLHWVSDFLKNKILYRVSENGCNKFLHQSLQLLSLEDQKKLPDSVYEMKKKMKRLALVHKTYDVCVNNCFLFYGDFESSTYTKCLECKAERYDTSRKMGANKKPIAYKKLWYFPIGARLQRLYMSRHTSEHMTWHLKCQRNNDRMIHPASGEAWKSFDRKYPDFAQEPRNVRLGICTDGFNPFGNGASYSCWPVFVTPYNLPPDFCMRQEYIFLSLLISGPKSPGKNIDVFLRPLIDELRLLWDEGVQTYDSFRKQNFQMRAYVMWTISDFPAYGMLSQWSTHGTLSCPYCMEKSKSFQLKNGRKTSFFDCHRRFLPLNHPWRSNIIDFTADREEWDEPLERRLGEEMEEHVNILPDVPFGATKYSIKGFGKKHNWCRRSIFWELPYWSTNMIRHNLDVMHCEKNFFDNIKNIVMDDPEKTKDNMNARKDLQLKTNRSGLFLVQRHDGKWLKPKAVYCLSKEQKQLVCDWLCGLKFPDGYASNISRCVQKQQLRLTGMKSHDCHVFMQRLVPIAFRDLLHNDVWEPLVEISNFFRALCSTEIKRSVMQELEESIVITMCKLEQIFPPSFFDSMEHLAIHLPWEAKNGGPVQYRWMYPFERRMYELKQSVGNRARVEGSISASYLLSEITNFTSHFFVDGVETRLNRLTRNETELNPDKVGQLSVFQNDGEPIGPENKYRNLSIEEYNAAQLYVLSNCPEVDCWSRLFLDEVCYGLNEQQSQSKRCAYFVPWLKERVQSGYYQVDPRVYALALGPLSKVYFYTGYKINGFRFGIESEGGGKKTTNSGVCVKASIGAPDETNFYGMLQEVIELFYCGGGQDQSIVLFKCIWYDITRGLTVHPIYRLIDIDPKKRLSTGASEPFILANQAQQVYYTHYPSPRKRKVWAVCTIKARHIVDTSSVQEENDGDIPEGQHVYQDDEAPITNVTGDLSSFGLINLADEEVELIQSDDESPAESGSEDDEDEDDDEDEEEEDDDDDNDDYS